MDETKELLEDLAGNFTEEDSLKEINETLREENIIGALVISECVWRFSYAGENYVIFNNRDQAERIAIQVIEGRLQNNDQSFNENLLSNHLVTDNAHNFAYRKAKKKYEYMEVEELTRDYRSGLSRGKTASEHRIFEARNMAISSYLNEILSDLNSKPMNYFREKEGLHSVFTVLGRYSEFRLDCLSAATDIIGKHSWGTYLSLGEEQMLFTNQGRIIVKEWA